MAFNSDTPQPLEAMRDSQPLFLDNFFELYQLFGVDHYNFDTAAIPSPNAGKHVKLTMTQQDKDTMPAPQVNDYLFFQALSALSGENQLYSKTAAGALLEFSDSKVFTEIGIGTTGWTALPSGVVIKWATRQININLPLVPIAPPNNALTVTFNWPTQPGMKVFTNQFWSYVTVVANNAPFSSPIFAVDDPCMVTYVKNISNPAQVQFTVWNRHSFNNQTPFNTVSFPQDFNFLIVSIGD